MNDLIEIIKKRLEEGGFKNVFDTMPDGRQYPEAVVLTFGIPERIIVDYSGTERLKYRVTTIVKRRTEPKAKTDAATAESILHNADLTSENDSYTIISVETNRPTPLPWNESGRYIWAFDTIITTTEGKDFF